MGVAAVKKSSRPTTKERPGTATRSARTDRQKQTPEPKATRRRASAAPALPLIDYAARRRRKVYVFGALAAVMSVTTALLLVMQPKPLTPDTVRTLMAVETPAQVNELFDTQTPVSTSRWRYIYVHHSGAAGGSAATLAPDGGPAGVPDHFVIGNGEGSGDGDIEIGQKWNLQQPPGKTRGVDRVESDCVSICLIGDFDRSSPTPRQMEQLTHLVKVLQDRLQIGANRVWAIDAPGVPAGCGRYFPRGAFQTGLLK